MLEDGNVTSAPQPDHHRVVHADAAVVLLDFRSQTRGLDADDRIHPRVVLIVAIENVDANGIFLEPVGFTGKRSLDYIAKESADAIGVGEQRARENPAELILDFCGGRLNVDGLHVTSISQIRGGAALRSRRY